MTPPVRCCCCHRIPRSRPAAALARRGPRHLQWCRSLTRRTKMFRNVLVGVDGRPNGRDAIALARNLIADDGKLTLAHVHGGELRPTRAAAKGMVRGEREASEKLLEAERAAADVSAELISVAAASPGRGLHLQAE